ncbi:MAG: hypothetical protein H7831_18765, partial [Magnetococcus sp. WYHC-3]
MTGIRRMVSGTTLLAMAALLAACGGGGGGSVGNTVSGQAVNGPFAQGSTVMLYELAANGTRTGRNVTDHVDDNLGTYSAQVPWSGPT